MSPREPVDGRGHLLHKVHLSDLDASVVIMPKTLKTYINSHLTDAAYHNTCRHFGSSCARQRRLSSRSLRKEKYEDEARHLHLVTMMYHHCNATSLVARRRGRRGRVVLLTDEHDEAWASDAIRNFEHSLRRYKASKQNMRRAASK